MREKLSFNNVIQILSWLTVILIPIFILYANFGYLISDSDFTDFFLLLAPAGCIVLIINSSLKKDFQASIIFFLVLVISSIFIIDEFVLNEAYSVQVPEPTINSSVEIVPIVTPIGE